MVAPSLFLKLKHSSLNLNNEFVMLNKNDLVVMGERLVSSFNEKGNQSTELAQWNRECGLSCSILLDYLKPDLPDVDKILFLVNLFKIKYKTAKPAVISNWCNQIADYLLTIKT